MSILRIDSSISFSPVLSTRCRGHDQRHGAWVRRVLHERVSGIFISYTALYHHVK
jgi:hypothetical protein